MFFPNAISCRVSGLSISRCTPSGWMPWSSIFQLICQRLKRQIDDSCLWKTLIKLLKNQGPFRPYVFNRSYIPSGWKLPFPCITQLTVKRLTILGRITAISFKDAGFSLRPHKSLFYTRDMPNQGSPSSVASSLRLNTLAQFEVCVYIATVYKSHFLNIFWKSQKCISRTP